MKNHRSVMRSIISLCLGVLICACLPQANSEAPESPEQEQAKVAVSDSMLALVMGRFDPSVHPDFVTIDRQYADREGLLLHKEAYSAFLKMHDAAAAEGIDMTIRSATRNFSYQKGIWERKWTGITKLSDGTSAADIADHKARALKILLYSSMPSTSRHHWGTDIDINAFENGYFESGEGLKLYEWMLDHAFDYGFCQPYTDKSDGRTGYEEEKWHWSYYPISERLTAIARDHLGDDMIEGFEGAEAATEIGVVKKYVLGIDAACPIE